MSLAFCGKKNLSSRKPLEHKEIKVDPIFVTVQEKSTNKRLSKNIHCVNIRHNLSFRKKNKNIYKRKCLLKRTRKYLSCIIKL